MCNVPQTFKEALSSSKPGICANAVEEEMDSLRENDTFTLTKSPEGKNPIGARWVSVVKDNLDETEAKG